MFCVSHCFATDFNIASMTGVKVKVQTHFSQCDPHVGVRTNAPLSQPVHSVPHRFSTHGNSALAIQCPCYNASICISLCFCMNETIVLMSDRQKNSKGILRGTWHLNSF